ncbi:hypothetical protein [Arthrobacter cavernae]|uniref:Uncharacterized protein n=1 Tax=Arthrobacter cavernae TaxID=2817681 RepID=A0A939HJ58_9MICC|nr:hypothetical protein [Arthrobacter cavernae]MBO1269470.1 hypothetical protein [Arthrobacter cavernae]
MTDVKGEGLPLQHVFTSNEIEYGEPEEFSELDFIQIPFPRSLSGLYSWSFLHPPMPVPGAGPNLDGTHEVSAEPQAAVPVFPLFGREELRLDVDGPYPQMTASGTSYSRFTELHHWIASLVKTGNNRWGGPIWYRDGNTTAFPYTRVDIAVVRVGILGQPNKATVTFSGAGITPLARTHTWKASTYRPVEFEFDATADANPVVSINTHDHPNRPVALPGESLSLDTVYRRAGFAVTNSGGNGQVPLSGAGANGVWSDAEMHDAMQTFWSRFTNAPRWSLWVLSAALHDQGTSLGGIMFDDIGPNHRQGTAIFTESFIQNAPPGDAAPNAWIRRMKFWTAAHEMGHAFNLAHSWQKSLGTPWLPLADEPEARSFMNYPFSVSGGQSAFFADFGFRFSDAELLFMRHAPARFVQMGNADWFDHHGFESPDSLERRPEFRLEVRANREKPVFEFLEPVTLELKLTNASAEPKIVRANILSPQAILAIIKRDGKPARQWQPYAQYCTEPAAQVLHSGEAVYESLPIYAGLNGWDVSEPGVYDISVAAEVDGEIVFSDPFRLRIAPPRSWDEEAVAGDFFTEDVGRTLAFTGTAVLETANDTLRETMERLPSSRAAIHAAAALAQPLVRDYKTLSIPDTETEMTSVAAANGSFKKRHAKVDEALSLVEATMTGQEAAETLGHIEFRRNVETFSEALDRAGAEDSAASMQTSLHDVLSDRGVLESVLNEVADKIEDYEPSDRSAGRKSRSSASSSPQRKNKPST